MKPPLRFPLFEKGHSKSGSGRPQDPGPGTDAKSVTKPLGREADRSSVTHRNGDRHAKRHRLYQEDRRILLLKAGLVGVVAGLLGVIYQLAVQQTQVLSTAAAALANSESITGRIALVAAGSGIGSAAAWAIGKWAPESGGSGIPHVKAALLHLRVIRAVPLLVAKFLGGLAALLVGMSFGREGPTVQMGSSAGKLVGDLTKVPVRNRDSLVAAGAGAGLAAAFNAPLAGFLFVMEELKREMSALTYGAALIASVCAVAVTRYLLGQQPSFHLSSPGSPPLAELPAIALLGLVAGLAGVLFNKSLLAALEIRTRCSVPKWVYGAVVGAIASSALLFFPQVTGGGHQLAQKLLSGTFRPEHVLLTVALLFLAKLFMTASSYGTGLPGGIFAPILVLGSVLGFGFGMAVHQIWPGVQFSPEGFATVGMAALLAGSVRAPLTGVVLIVEMTAEYNLLYALLICAFVADLVAEAVKDKPIYEALMERDLRLSGSELHEDAEPLILEFLIEPNSLLDGRRIKSLKFPPGLVFATLERGSSRIVPSGNTVLRAGDSVSVLIEGDKPDLSLMLHESAKAP